MANIILPGGFDTHLPTPGTVFGTVVDVVRGAISGGAAAAAQDIQPTPVTTITNPNGQRFQLDNNSALVSHDEFAQFTRYSQQQFQRIYQALGGLAQGGGDFGGGGGFGGGDSGMLMMLLLLNPTTPGATPAIDTTTLLLIMMMGQQGGGFGGGFGGGGNSGMLMMLLLLGGI